MSMSKEDDKYFRLTSNSTAEAMHHLIKDSGDSVAVFVIFAPEDETAKENTFIDLSGGMHIQGALPRPKVTSFPYIYRCGDYFGDPGDIILFTSINPESLYEPLIKIKAGLCELWDLFAEYQTSVDLSYAMAYVVTDVMKYVKFGLVELDPHKLWDARYPYVAMKDELIQKALHTIAQKHREHLASGRVPYYTVR